MKNKKLKEILYWVLSLTWGLPMTLVGAITTLVLICTGHKPKKFGWSIYLNVGKNWGGAEFGAFFLVDESDEYSLKCHEHGHGIQNIIWGPLFPFVIGFRSAARYWIREIKPYKKKVAFVTTLLTMCSIVVLVLVLAGCFANVLLLIIVGTLLFGYFGWLCFWIAFVELPKYKSKPYPAYDDFWPEAQATKWGTQLVEKLVDNHSGV